VFVRRKRNLQKRRIRKKKESRGSEEAKDGTQLVQLVPVQPALPSPNPRSYWKFCSGGKLEFPNPQGIGRVGEKANTCPASTLAHPYRSLKPLNPRPPHTHLTIKLTCIVSIWLLYRMYRYIMSYDAINRICFLHA
jgi:hypothetical protein